jgi:hypothetical protein
MEIKGPAYANRDHKYLQQWGAYVGKWKRRTIGLGIALILSIALLVPFLAGQSLHRYFQQGRYLIYLSCCLLSLFLGSAALTYNFWSHWRSLRAESHGAGPSRD